MSKVLFLTNTHFQLITALQIIRTFYPDDEVDILISDYSLNSDKIVEKINSCECVHHAYYVQTSSLSLSNNNLDRIANIFKIIRFHKSCKRVIGFALDKYDIFLFHNLDFATYVIFENLIQANENLIVRRFEEGFNIYLSFNEKVKSQGLCEKYYKIVGKPSLVDRIEYIYLYHPELVTYNLKHTVKQIPVLNKSDSEFINVVNQVFDINERITYAEKVILFEECFWADGYDVKDAELFFKIADIMEPDKVIVKLHPRNRRNRFENTKCITDTNSALPWEVIQMNEDFSEKIFITVSSGSVLASLLYFKEMIPTIFLFKLIDNSFPLKPHYEEYIHKILRNVPGNKVLIPSSLDELQSILQSLKANDI